MPRGKQNIKDNATAVNIDDFFEAGRTLSLPPADVKRHVTSVKGPNGPVLKQGSQRTFRDIFNHMVAIEFDIPFDPDSENNIVTPEIIASAHDTIRFELYGVRKLSKGKFTFKQLKKERPDAIVELREILENEFEELAIGKNHWPADMVMEEVLRRDRESANAKTNDGSKAANSKGTGKKVKADRGNVSKDRNRKSKEPMLNGANVAARMTRRSSQPTDQNETAQASSGRQINSIGTKEMSPCKSASCSDAGIDESDEERCHSASSNPSNEENISAGRGQNHDETVNSVGAEKATDHVDHEQNGSRSDNTDIEVGRKVSKGDSTPKSGRHSGHTASAGALPQSRILKNIMSTTRRRKRAIIEDSSEEENEGNKKTARHSTKKRKTSRK